MIHHLFREACRDSESCIHDNEYSCSTYSGFCPKLTNNRQLVESDFGKTYKFPANPVAEFQRQHPKCLLKHRMPWFQEIYSDGVRAISKVGLGVQTLVVYTSVAYNASKCRLHILAKIQGKRPKHTLA